MFSDSYMRKSHPNKLATVPNTFPLWTLQGHLSVLFLPSEEECTLINVVLVNIVIYHHKKKKVILRAHMVYDTISVIYLYYHFSVSPHIPCRLANMKTSGLTPATGKMLRQSQYDLNVKKYLCRGLWVQTLRLEKCMDSNKHIISPLSNSSVENIQVISSNV